MVFIDFHDCTFPFFVFLLAVTLATLSLAPDYVVLHLILRLMSRFCACSCACWACFCAFIELSLRLIVRLLRLIRACSRLILSTLEPDFVVLHLPCAFSAPCSCACLRLLLHLILIRPEIKRKRLRFLSRLLVRLLLRLLSRLMVNPHWVVHFHFIFGFSFEGKPSQILQI